jgi:hypothetical protein
MEVFVKAFRFVSILFGFKEALLTNRKLVDDVCECLFSMYKVEPKPAKGSDEYFRQCLTLVLENEDASDVFYRFALLRILPG